MNAPITPPLPGNVMLTVALAGQPNVGKSTLFNLLTGLDQHIGNWPGKTVEQRTGTHRSGGSVLHLVDLPGTYSLSANSPEEVIARDYLLRERPDIVVAVVNAASLERNLYLVAELLPLASRLVVAVNMIDVAADQGLTLEPRVLSAALGVPVVSMSAARNEGVQELVDTVVHLARGQIECHPRLPEIRPDHREVLGQLRAMIAGRVPEPYPEEWAALKLLEGDAEITARVRGVLPVQVWRRVHDILIAHEDAVLSVAGGRYEWVGRMIRAAVTRPRAGQITLTERLDRWATHPIWGLVILAGILGVVFWLTFAVGKPLQGLLDTAVVHTLGRWVSGWLADAPAWMRGLVVDGIIGGAGTVLTFLPILAIFFAVLALLEDVGYMARAAYVMDRFMHLMGLHGKSFLPLFLGFGCNVPAVVGSRIIESGRARLLTILLTPLVPCAARMTVIVFIAPVFFGRSAPLVAVALVGGSLVVLAAAGVVLGRWVLRGERAAFIMELPLYHRPKAATIGLQVWQNSAEFLKKAGTLILIMSVVIWALSTLPHGQIETSYLASIGKALTPVGRLMGQDWKMIVALLSSLVAKENSIVTLGVLFGAADNPSGLSASLARSLAPASALAFLVAQMLFIPCVATVAAMQQETRSWKWTAFATVLLAALSLAGGILTYQAARLF
ncbi:MAG TPA: ferrous iron transport protein B [Anaerolineae bacterium]|nr:ferrous iron transport protein B [Anaerolineae bacterium]